MNKKGAINTKISNVAGKHIEYEQAHQIALKLFKRPKTGVNVVKDVGDNILNLTRLHITRELAHYVTFDGKDKKVIARWKSALATVKNELAERKQVSNDNLASL